MILGAILAGGRSSRFGTDKASAIWRGARLIDHVRDRLATVTAKIIVCGGSIEGYEVIADAPGADLGPLGGLASALRHASGEGFDRVLTMPCDTPTIEPAALAALAAATGDAFLEALPVIGCWQACHSALLDTHLASEANRSMRRWAAAIGATPLHLPPPPNINYPGDLAVLD